MIFDLCNFILMCMSIECSSSLVLSFGNEPIHAVKSEGQYIWDEDGTRYLDAYNGTVSVVGHCHEYVTSAVEKQLKQINTNTRYLHSNVLELAQRLIALSNNCTASDHAIQGNTKRPQLSLCFFVNSGSEANDLAVRLARAYRESCEMIVLERSYHGGSVACVELSDSKHKNGYDVPTHIHKVQSPDGFRGPYTYSQSNCGALYAAEIQTRIGEIHSKVCCALLIRFVVCGCFRSSRRIVFLIFCKSCVEQEGVCVLLRVSPRCWRSGNLMSVFVKALYTSFAQ